jgi:hypothetical protein
MVSRDAAQEEAARQIAPGSRTIRSGFWNTLCPPRHCPAKTPFHNFLPQGTAAFKRQRNAYTPFRNESARIEPLGEESCQRAYRQTVAHIRPLSGLLVGSPAQGA